MRSGAGASTPPNRAAIGVTAAAAPMEASDREKLPSACGHRADHTAERRGIRGRFRRGTDSTRRFPGAWLVAMACLAEACGAPGEPAAAPTATSRSWPFNRYFRELKTARVSAAGRALTMLLDTGGGATLITPAVAAQIGCSPFGRDVGHRMTGEAVEFQRCEALHVVVWSLAAANRAGGGLRRQPAASA